MGFLIRRDVNFSREIPKGMQEINNQLHRCTTWARKSAIADPISTLSVFVLGVAFVALLARLFNTVITRYKHVPTSLSLEKGPAPVKASHRNPGDPWIPIEFNYPPVTPLAELPKPKPYRPFRYGAYHITMGLRSMQWNDWIELDTEYETFHKLKAERIKERGHKSCHTDPKARGAAIELLEELVAFLPQRYPSLFRRWEKGIENLLTGEKFDTTLMGMTEDPMIICARLVQDDLALMLEGHDGQYYLLAGAILLAGFWRLEDKLGMGLSEIHTSGDVPGFKSKLERGMLNFFRRVMPDKPVVRNNYFIQADDKLPWSHSIGPESSAPGTFGWSSAAKTKAIDQHYFRSERQSLRRLPKSGAVLFTIRTYFVPVKEICEDPGVAGRLASAVRSWGDDVAKYKGREVFGDVLLEWLDDKHREQIKQGVVTEGEEEEGRYPF